VALAEVLHTIEELVTASLSDKPPTDEQRIAIVKHLGEALTAFREADTNLLEVQADNPYPEAPSEFCPVDTSLPDIDE